MSLWVHGFAAIVVLAVRKTNKRILFLVERPKPHANTMRRAVIMIREGRDYGVCCSTCICEIIGQSRILA